MKGYRIVVFCLASLVFSACGNKGQSTEPHASNPEPKKNQSVAISSLSSKSDPVCGMALTEGEVADTMIFEGKSYGFCNPGCKSEFVKNPSQYLSQK